MVVYRFSDYTETVYGILDIEAELDMVLSVVGLVKSDPEYSYDDLTNTLEEYNIDFNELEIIDVDF